jgi:hypothetical protein
MTMITNALTINRSAYTGGRPRPRFGGGSGIGIRSTSLTNVTSNGSRGSIQLPFGMDVSQLKYYEGGRALAMPWRGVFLFVFSAYSIYDHASIKHTLAVEHRPSRKHGAG